MITDGDDHPFIAAGKAHALQEKNSATHCSLYGSVTDYKMVEQR